MRNYSRDFQSECANSVDTAIRLASRVVDLICNFSKLKPCLASNYAYFCSCAK